MSGDASHSGDNAPASLSQHVRSPCPLPGRPGPNTTAVELFGAYATWACRVTRYRWLRHRGLRGRCGFRYFRSALYDPRHVIGELSLDSFCATSRPMKSASTSAVQTQATRPLAAPGPPIWRQLTVAPRNRQPSTSTSSSRYRRGRRATGAAFEHWPRAGGDAFPRGRLRNKHSAGSARPGRRRPPSTISFSVSAAARRCMHGSPGNSDSTFYQLPFDHYLRGVAGRGGSIGPARVQVWTNSPNSEHTTTISASHAAPIPITPSTDPRIADLTLSARIFHSGFPGSISPLRRSHSATSASSSTTTCS